MAKVFQAGAPLLASEINNELNPSTAPHVPYAVASGMWTGPISASAGAYFSTSVSLPASRFTKTPVVVGNVASVASGNSKLTLKLIPQNTSSFLIYLFNGDGTAISGTTNISWIAVQQDA